MNWIIYLFMEHWLIVSCLLLHKFIIYTLIHTTVSSRGPKIPTPTKNSYNDHAHNSFTWKSNLSISEAFAPLEKEEQGLTVFFSFTDQDKQAVRIIRVKTLSSANGLKLIIEELDKLYLKDEVVQHMNHTKNFKSSRGLIRYL